MKYAVVIEHTEGGGYSAYVPDLPGFGAAAATLEGVKELVAEGVPFHIEGLRRHGYPVPPPMTLMDSVSVAEETTEEYV